MKFVPIIIGAPIHKQSKVFVYEGLKAPEAK